MRTHKDLDVWKMAMEFVTEIYRVTEGFPKSEEFGLKSQIRRAAVSVPANIAEGAARQSKKEFTQFLFVSIGSLSELETLMMICDNLGFLHKEGILHKVEVLRKMVFGLKDSLV